MVEKGKSSKGANAGKGELLPASGNARNHSSMWGQDRLIEPVIRWDKILAIRAAIAKGTYNIPTHRLVDSLLPRLRQAIEVTEGGCSLR
ncbi:MAG: flagellar biosynthesis anti-sigma factor FlgM [Janthinobacterium lividum]